MIKNLAHKLQQTLSSRFQQSRLSHWRPLKALVLFLQSWWHILTICIIAFICLYYPLGGYLVHNIDTNTNYEIKQSNPEQSATIEMASFLINREVNDKLWTANLPFFYPSYFLDNMPSFQLGVIKAVGNVTSALSQKLSPSITNPEDPELLHQAAKLLRYPGTVWMFSPDNKLLPAPSSTAQYRKARHDLIAYNELLLNKKVVFYRSATDLSYFLTQISRSLGASEARLSAHIREHNTDWFDTKADNVFYYNQGKAYGFYLLLKAMGHDYQQIIVDSGQYENWTKLLNALQSASELSPSVVRNAELNSIFSANHLNYLGFYIIKAQNLISQITTALTTPHNKDKN